jgi:murein DD-endopeptidase MepM/ murein hydrolase activator NlpD
VGISRAGSGQSSTFNAHGVPIGIAVAGALLTAAAIWVSSQFAPPRTDQDRQGPASHQIAPVSAGAEIAAAATHALEPIVSAAEVIVRRDDTLDAIFHRLELSIEDLSAIRNLPGIRQSLDYLRPGDVIRFTYLNGELRSLERRVSETQTLSVARSSSGSFAAQMVTNPVQRRPAPVHGEIGSSLFRTMNDLGESDALATQLAEVFRYDIDFAQELRSGDSFTVVVDKIYRDGQFLRDGEILAAEFVNGGHLYRAIRYTGRDGNSDYYTPDGKSLRKEFLRAPLEFTRISSGFGLRHHPILDRVRAHQGIDYAAPQGTPVRAAGDGRVRFRGINGGYGNVIVLVHSGGIETLYGHLSRFAAGVGIGSHVHQGTLIGYVGMTGLATGPHLHYEYRVNGIHRNPASIKTLPATPISPALKPDFDARTQDLLVELEAARGGQPPVR